MCKADPKPSKEDRRTTATKGSKGKQGVLADDEDEAPEKGCFIRDVNGVAVMLSFQCNANTHDLTATKEPSDQDESPEASERSKGQKRAQEHDEDQDEHNVFSVNSTNSGPILFCCLSNVMPIYAMPTHNRAQQPRCF